VSASIWFVSHDTLTASRASGAPCSFKFQTSNTFDFPTEKNCRRSKKLRRDDATPSDDAQDLCDTIRQTVLRRVSNDLELDWLTSVC
jgi:hypothetical protein